MQSFFFFLITAFPLFFIKDLSAHPVRWNVLICMQADDILKSPTDASLKALIHKIESFGEQVRLSVQITTQGTCSRYSNVECRTCLKKVAHAVPISCDYETLLKGAVQWAYEGSDNSMTLLIFSGHGSGILEPAWHEGSKRCMYAEDEGPCYYADYRAKLNQQFFDTSVALCDGHKSLFLEQSTALTCVQLKRVIEYAAQIRGRKVDIIGFDACHMAMLEIAFLLAPSAHYMVASQDCEEKEGWEYAALLSRLSTEINGISGSRALVYAHEKAQRKNRCPFYSLSAIDLSCMNTVTCHFEKLTKQLNLCLSRNGSSFHDVLCRAREHNQRFCLLPQYADIRCFCEHLIHELFRIETTSDYELLYEALYDTLEMLQSLVIAHAASERCSLAYGCSVYFPYACIDPSYQSNEFAQATQWRTFLQKFIARRF